MTSAKGKHQPVYDEAFKARAVARLISEGYPDKRGVLSKVAKDLGVTHVTLRSWAKGKAGAPDPEDVQVTVDMMIGGLDGKLEMIIEEMEAKVGKASFRDLAVAYGILFDKRQLLIGAPTSRSERSVKDMRMKSNAELDTIIAKAKAIADKGLKDVGLSPAARRSRTSPSHLSN